MDAKEKVVRALYGARAQSRHDLVRELLADDVLWHEPGEEDYSGDYHGPDEVVRLLDKLEVTQGSFALEPTDFLLTEDHAAAKIRWSALRDGRRVEGNELAIYRFRNGKIAEVWFHPDGYDPAALREVFSY